jgi:hypothetical protein
LQSDITDYDPNTDNSKKQYADLHDRAIALPPKERAHALAMLARQQKEGAGGDNGFTVINELAKQQAFGDTKEDFNTVNARKWELQQQLTKWKANNPDATAAEEREQVQKWTHQDVLKAVAKKLDPNNEGGTEISTKAELDALKPGAPFIWVGADGKKRKGTKALR